MHLLVFLFRTKVVMIISLELYHRIHFKLLHSLMLYSRLNGLMYQLCHRKASMEILA